MTEANGTKNSSLPGDVKQIEDIEGYGSHYNDPDFFQKLKSLPGSVVSNVIFRAMLLRELLFDNATPLLVRGTIAGVLGYFLLPIDLIPDVIPGIGFVDDIAAMGLVLASLDNLVTDEIRQRALKRMPAILRPKRT